MALARILAAGAGAIVRDGLDASPLLGGLLAGAYTRPPFGSTQALSVG